MSRAWYDSVMFGQGIVHQFSLGFDWLSEANFVRPRDEYNSEICFLTFVANDNWSALI